LPTHQLSKSPLAKKTKRKRREYTKEDVRGCSGSILRPGPPLQSRHELTDGSTEGTELLVGADGARSRIRPLLSDAKPEYVSTTFIEIYLYDADERHSAAAEAGWRRRTVCRWRASKSRQRA
jgi:2-polyprenyl-6-methoxyphenol hydroxylase-like FAD-dependent oxidoreductase